MIDLKAIFPQPVYARRIARDVLPGVAVALTRWREKIASIPNVELQRQAWASITSKRFHAEGGSVYAALVPQWADTLVPLIVALQTISDYLDNLCDRSVSMNEDDFRQLHAAMSDAVDGSPPRSTEPAALGLVPAASSGGPGRRVWSESQEKNHGPRKPSPYYTHHPNKDDGDYLDALVDECRLHISKLPSYPIVKPHIQKLVGLYNDLQVYKHGPVDGRVRALEGWFARAGHRWPDLYWWEFAAAAGSTLGVFALLTAATRPDLTAAEAEAIVHSYFPWICGLHILLDYLIDQAEDVAGGDLNLVSFYPDEEFMRTRLVLFIRKARECAARMPEPAFHTTIVQGLPGLYLSDRKVTQQRMQRTARALLRASGPASFCYYVWCRLRRAFDPHAHPGPAPCDRAAPRR